MVKIIGKIFLILILLYILLPILSSVIFAFSTKWDTTILPEGFSIETFEKVITNPDFWLSLLHSSILSVSVIFLSVILILPAALAVELKLPQFRSFLELFSIFPYAIPPVLLALGIIQVFAPLPIPIYGTPLLLILAVTTLVLPFTYRTIDNALQATNAKQLIEAALTLGADWITIMQKILFPNILTGLQNGSLLVASLVFGEFVFANLLVGTNWITIPVWTFKVSRIDGKIGSVLAVINFVFVYILSSLLLSKGELGGIPIVSGVKRDKKKFS
ncbi:putative spermidine/putrescine transport system permease protein [Caldanaerovirga acetigignens]|uniref:Putative spermidine/putrescine transport system permease protein n=1 Tax=Caldanaerovirga acetigignens TaxID=447595 RepID=A0A1M7HSG8_9FIRM|nr:ABC transporter permease subunit [Caldanaerovirga acetigignens]SHM31349.1 putative spermidine/putrescine transport system permease protein [Caldanaerovirga acetigignens]